VRDSFKHRGLPPLAPLVITVMIVIGLGVVVLDGLQDQVKDWPEHVDRVCANYSVDGVVVNGTEYSCVLGGPEFSIESVAVIPLIGALIYLTIHLK